MTKSYLADTLQPGETVLHRGRIHPAYLLIPTLVALLIFFGTFKAIRYFDFPQISLWTWAILLLPAFYWVQHILIYATSEAALTNRRVMSKTGFISRRISEISLGKIESSTIEQGLIGRTFGFGDLVIKGSGGHLVSAPGIEKIMTFRAAVQNSIP